MKAKQPDSSCPALCTVRGRTAEHTTVRVPQEALSGLHSGRHLPAVGARCPPVYGLNNAAPAATRRARERNLWAGQHRRGQTQECIYARGTQTMVPLGTRASAAEGEQNYHRERQDSGRCSVLRSSVHVQIHAGCSRGRGRMEKETARRESKKTTSTATNKGVGRLEACNQCVNNNVGTH